MAVTVDQFAFHLGLTAPQVGSDEYVELDLHVKTGAALLTKLYPDAPEDPIDLATQLLSAYVYDAPYSVRGAGFGAAMINSGARDILKPWYVPELKKGGI